MELAGETIIAADRATVWARLNDPATLRAAIPGCTLFEARGPVQFAARVEQRLALVRLAFEGTVTLSDVVPGVSYTMTAAGAGGAAGLAQGHADVTLHDVPGGTALRYVIGVGVGGRLAQFGEGVIAKFARWMAAQFFEGFRHQVEGDAAPSQPTG